MADKTRIVETEDGRFMAQCKSGWFGRWKFLRAGADTDTSLLLIWLQVEDPAAAASFPTEVEARAFLDRFNARVAAHWQEHEASRRRAMEGVQVKRALPSKSPDAPDA